MSEPGSPFIDENEPQPEDLGTPPAAEMDRQRLMLIIGGSVAGVAVIAGAVFLLKSHLPGGGADTGTTQSAASSSGQVTPGATPTVSPSASVSTSSSALPASARDPFTSIVPGGSAAPSAASSAAAGTTGAGAGATGTGTTDTGSGTSSSGSGSTDFFGVPGLGSGTSDGGSSDGGSSGGGSSAPVAIPTTGGSSSSPTPKPSAKPTVKPTAKPTIKPTATPKPSATPTPSPTAAAKVRFYVSDDAYIDPDGVTRVPVYLDGVRAGDVAIGDIFGKTRFTCTNVDLSGHRAAFLDGKTNTSFTVLFAHSTTR